MFAEAPTPAGLRAELRPYQKQSLAFMLERERAPDGSPHIGSARTNDFNWSPGGEQMFQKLVETNWRADSTMYTCERDIYSPSPAHRKRVVRAFHIRGGFLCDEVGMGKTAVCIALSGESFSRK